MVIHCLVVTTSTLTIIASELNTFHQGEIMTFSGSHLLSKSEYDS